jgi:VanZ family protein
MDGVVLYLCLVQSDKLPVVTIENLDKVVHAFFHFVFTSLWILFFKTQIKHQIVINRMLFHFVFCSFLELQSKLSRAIHNNQKEDALDVVANTAGAALAVFVSFYIILKGRLDKI